MIPQIQIISPTASLEDLVAACALKYHISPSHRIIIQPENDELTVEQIHLMQRDIQVSFSQTVLVALCGVDNSSAEVQNALLKSLEEDSSRILFLLLVTQPSRLLTTIRSRCSILDMPSLPHRNQAQPLDSEVFSWKLNTAASKEEALNRIDTYLENNPPHNLKTLSHILSIRKLLMDNNMNPVLALDSILIFLTKTGTMKLS